MITIAHPEQSSGELKKSGQTKQQIAEASSPHLETVTQENNKICSSTKEQVAEASSLYVKTVAANQIKPVIPHASSFSKQLQKENRINQEKAKDEEKDSVTAGSQKKKKR